MNATDRLGTEKTHKLVWQLAIPCLLAQFVNVLYSVIDRMYIGNIKDIGAAALAGVGICGPIVTLISGFGILIGVGGSPLMSIKLGEKNEDAAKKIMANCFILLIIVSFVTMFAALLLKSKLLSWFGASPATMGYASSYLTVYLFGTVFSLLSVGLNLFVVCQGYAKSAMIAVLVGAVLNIALDPLFIFTFKMGVAGAALATVISQAFSAAFVVIFLLSKKATVRISFGGYSFKIIRKILTVGFSPFIIIATDSIILICLNASLATHGGANADLLITCATIAQSFMLIVTMPLGGITSGTQTILGYNYGAKNPARIKSASKHILLLCVIFTSLMFIIAQALPQYFVRLFTADAEIASKSVWAIRIFTLAIIPLSFQYTFVDGLTAIGKTHIAIILSLVRKTIFTLIVFTFPFFLGAQGVFYSEPIADIAASIISCTVFIIVMRKILKRLTDYQPISL